MTPLLQFWAGIALAVLTLSTGYWLGLRERRRRLRRAVLRGTTGVNRLQFQSADDGAMEMVVRRKDLKGILKGEQIEGKLVGAGGASMIFRVKAVL